MKNLALFFLMLFSFPQDDYKSFFNRGMDEMINKNEKQALEYFLKSYHLQKHSKTCYYIALCYFNSENYKEAKIYALEAKSRTPVLAKIPYMNKIDTILRYEPTNLTRFQVITESRERFRSSGTLHEVQKTNNLIENKQPANIKIPSNFNSKINNDKH